MKTLLIDGNSLINRAFYALPLLSTEDGTYTNGVYGFLNMLYRVLDDYQPHNVITAFDLKTPTFRHQMYADYKAGRKPMPPELVPQIPLLKEVLQTIGVVCCEYAGYEADDLLGTYSLLSEEAGGDCVILTGDRDALQLISDHTSVWLTKKGISETEKLDPAGLKAQHGLEPDQVRDLKGLMGDPSDHIPGVPGVGEKTALKLLEEFFTVENLYEHVDEVPGKLGEKLRENRTSAFESKTLATIVRNVPVEKPLADCGYIRPSDQVLAEIFTKYQFKSLLQRLGERVIVQKDEQVPPETLPFTGFINTPTQLAVVLTGNEIFVAETEEKQYELSLCTDLLGNGVTMEVATEQLKPFLTDPAIPKIFYDSKADAHRFGFESLPITEDVSLAEYLLDAANSDRALSMLCQKYGAVEGAAGLLRISRMQQKELKKKGLLSLYRELELPLSHVLYEMEQTGFYVDGQILRALGVEFSQKITALTGEIYELAGREFNINSPKQLSEILFSDLGLVGKRKTKTGFSTDTDALEELDHPIIRPLMEYRQAQKLKGTYIDGMYGLISPVDGRIHTTFNQAVTATGRLSSTEPNLQNIPVRTEYGRSIRKAFVSEKEDFVLVNADYSQIELRILSHLSGDETMISSFLSGEDIHARTAAEVFAVPLEQVTPAQRSAAKAVNFGIIYGISDFGLARNTGVSRKQAAAYIETYFSRYPAVRRFMDEAVENAKKNGYITTILGRRREIPELAAHNYNIRSFGERVAMNAPIQGSAADIIKLAMLAVHNSLEKEGLQGKLILQVHDELILEVRRQDAEQAKTLLKREMEGVYQMRVPLTAEAKAGKSWYELK